MKRNVKNVIVDLDGTVADCEHRLHFVDGVEKKNWDAFYAEVGADGEHEDIVRLVNMLWEQDGVNIHYVTGRPERTRLATQNWMYNAGLPLSKIHMRADGDHRPDHEVKAEVARRMNFTSETVWFVLEDRDSIVAMWRGLGVRVLQVAPGAF